MRFSIGWLVLALACGGAGEAETAPTETTAVETQSGGEETAAADAEVPWSDMDRAQRLAYMRETVMPEMAAMFREFDPERYADFGCASCHGENMQEVDFQMPNGLAPLPPDQIGAMFQSDQPMAVFMTQRVWPKMVELLGAQPYDPETHQGFGCFGCHAIAEGG